MLVSLSSPEGGLCGTQDDENDGPGCILKLEVYEAVPLTMDSMVITPCETELRNDTDTTSQHSDERQLPSGKVTGQDEVVMETEVYYATYIGMDSFIIEAQDWKQEQQ